MNSFRDITEREIDENLIRSVPKNTEKSKNSIWRQFMSFCAKKKSNRETPVSEIAFIFKKWVFIIRNILPKYHLCLKIKRIISIQTSCLITLLTTKNHQNYR
jgi:hypothetical protein